MIQPKSVVFENVDEETGEVTFRDAITIEEYQTAERPEELMLERYEHFMSGGDENPIIPEDE